MGTRRITRMALLTAAALIIFLVEAQIPSPVPIPGVKLGLANVVTLYALFTMTAGETLLILLARVTLGSLFSGQPATFFYSLAGGLLCFALTALLRRAVGRRQIWVCGMLGAAAHNLGQLLMAAALTRTWVVFYYFPPLLLSALLTGLFTGLTAQFLVGHMGKLKGK